LAARVLDANIMITDNDLNIVFMNEAVTQMLRVAEADLKKSLPHFSVDRLIGSNIDSFHRDPSHQRRMLQALSSKHRATIKIGTLTFDLVASPLKQDNGTRIGTVVEWADATVRLQNQKYAAQVAAASRAQAMIEFELDGTIVTANENFCKALGYSLAEIKGKHHSIFIPPAERESASYREFWAALNRGEYQSGEFKRIGRGGNEVWILASYNPELDDNGKPFGVVKFATDVTAEKLRNADLAGQIAAIDKAQAVIEFNMDGTIVTANNNFLGTLGYSLEEIRGKHHSIFVEPSERSTAAYREFWAALNRGQYQAAEYKRIGKGGKEVYIQASYNPILDLNGKPF
jgi:methyl-accepting chemotaxis protein